jgi:hypothetical protein
MKFEKTEVFNFEGALRGMRNPKNSWSNSDSYWEQTTKFEDGYRVFEYRIGQNDLKLAQSLIKAGSEHRKFMRQIFVSVDITAPLYWWKEFDTYKVGTVANSTSTMHRLASTPITKDCFEMDDYLPVIEDDELGYSYATDVYWRNTIKHLEELRELYMRTKDIRLWKELIRELPDSWLQTRTVTFDYENLLAICSIGQRRFHKLTEWSLAFISWARTLPYAKELIFLDEYERKKEEEKNG